MIQNRPEMVNDEYTGSFRNMNRVAGEWHSDCLSHRMDYSENYSYSRRGWSKANLAFLGSQLHLEWLEKK